MFIRDIKMKIRSVRYDVEESLFSKLVGDDESIIESENLEFDEAEAIEINTEGKLKDDGERVEVIYDESEITGMEGSHTSVYFEKKNDGLVCMHRSGSVSTSLVFERGKRHHCVYNTPIMPFEICVRTIKVENRMLSDGILSLDYVIEIRGAKAERTKFELSIIE